MPFMGSCLTISSHALKDSLDEFGGELLPILKGAGFADALVATLKSESAYSVSLAARVLTHIGQISNGGQALVEACGAIPALVHVMKKTRWPNEPEKENGPYGRYAIIRPRLGCAYVQGLV
jgi:hypothetical protein